MLQVKCPEYFARVCAFAAGRSSFHVKALWDRLWYLHTYGAGNKFGDLPMLAYETMREVPKEWASGPEGFVVELTKDWAPASFGFLIAKNGSHWFTGGLIYHGDQSGWDESKPFYCDPLSVTVGPADLWSVHT